MSKYPAFLSGQRLTAALLAATQWDKTMKTLATPKTNATLANDPELSGVVLGVGQWDIRMLIFASNTVTTGNLRTQWSFTGTWNNPLRACVGPDLTTGGPSDITEMSLQAFATNSSRDYDLGNTSAYTGIQEFTSTAVVTVAGQLALSWAQATANATATNVQPGSYIECRQIA
jgi:hypothetical protein